MRSFFDFLLRDSLMFFLLLSIITVPIMGHHIDIKCFTNDVVTILIDIFSNCYDSLSPTCLNSIKACANYNEIDNFSCCKCLPESFKQIRKWSLKTLFLIK